MLYKTRKANIKGISVSDNVIFPSPVFSCRLCLSIRSQMSCDNSSAFARLPGTDGYKTQ